MLSKFLNYFTINQNLRCKWRTWIFIREISRIFVDRLIRWRPIEGHDHAIIVGHDLTIPWSFPRPMKIGSSWCIHMSTTIAKIVIKSRVSDVYLRDLPSSWELGKFERYLWNSIKSDSKLSLEIRDFLILRKITQLQIHGIKTRVIWMRIREVIEVRKWLKTKIKTKLHLIYDSKCKTNTIMKD